MVANYLKKILSYLKDMALFNQKHKERIIVNINESLERQIKEICQIPQEEKIKNIIDDSQWHNLQEIIVFTDNNIYWHMKDAYMKIKEENTEIIVKGHGLINNKELNAVSVFSNNINKLKYIYIISSSLQIILPFKNIEIEHSLTLTFYEYISKHSDGYKPNTVTNETIFKTISANNNYSNNNNYYKEMIIKKKKSPIKRIFNLIGIIIIFILLYIIINWLERIGVLNLGILYEYLESII
ncbi:MAG: hypothetical protein LBT00_12765 [Spirochaetaceae bacterium]|jgi:hypothetical protein|nr:hypothetical protein [Spirochaetaceae bacterium]